MTVQFGEMIRRARERNGWLGRQLAAKLEVDSATITRLERGSFKDTPSPELLHRIHEVLGISQIELLEALGYEIRNEPNPKINPDDPKERLIQAVRDSAMPLHYLDTFRELLEGWRHAGTDRPAPERSESND